MELPAFGPSDCDAIDIALGVLPWEALDFYMAGALAACSRRLSSAFAPLRECRRIQLLPDVSDTSLREHLSLKDKALFGPDVIQALADVLVSK